MTRNEKVKVLSQLLAGQPTGLVQLKRLYQPVTNELAHLTDEELEQQIAEINAEMLAAGIEKTAEDIALREEIEKLKARINSWNEPKKLPY